MCFPQATCKSIAHRCMGLDVWIDYSGAESARARGRIKSVPAPAATSILSRRIWVTSPNATSVCFVPDSTWAAFCGCCAAKFRVERRFSTDPGQPFQQAELEQKIERCWDSEIDPCERDAAPASDKENFHTTRKCSGAPLRRHAILSQWNPYSRSSGSKGNFCQRLGQSAVQPASRIT